MAAGVVLVFVHWRPCNGGPSSGKICVDRGYGRLYVLLTVAIGDLRNDVLVVMSALTAAVGGCRLFRRLLLELGRQWPSEIRKRSLYRNTPP